MMTTGFLESPCESMRAICRLKMRPTRPAGQPQELDELSKACLSTLSTSQKALSRPVEYKLLVLTTRFFFIIATFSDSLHSIPTSYLLRMLPFTPQNNFDSPQRAPGAPRHRPNRHQRRRSRFVSGTPTPLSADDMAYEIDRLRSELGRARQRANWYARAFEGQKGEIQALRGEFPTLSVS
jgi:hypothetical protein